MQQVQKNDGFLAVSDGLVIFHYMNYGWVVATPNGKILAWSEGPCNGKGNSLQAKGVGMLSVTVFFALMVEYTKSGLLMVTFVSDNQELINRCDAHLQYIIPYLNKTVKSEYDVTEQMYCTALIYNLKPSYHWVKGHQDDNTSTEELSIVAQLNVEADRLAGEFQKDHGKFRPLVTLLPSCLAMLSIRGTSITSNYNKQLIKAYIKPWYIGYIQEKYSWSDSGIQIIAWKCLTLALQQINRDVVLTKICNDILPSHAKLFKEQQYSDNKCTLCGNSETSVHLILCKTESRTKWQRQFMTKLWKKWISIKQTMSWKRLCVYGHRRLDWKQHDRDKQIPTEISWHSDYSRKYWIVSYSKDTFLKNG